MTTDPLPDQLATLGLTDGAIEIYGHLLEEGSMPIRDLAEGVEYTRQSVYRLCEDLQACGLVRINSIARPQTVHPVSGERFKETRAATLQPLAETIDQRLEGGPGAYDPIEALKSEQAAIERLEFIIEQAETDLQIQVPISVLESIYPALEAAIERNVFVQLVIGEYDDPSEFPLSPKPAVVRATQDRVTTMAIADHEAAATGHKYFFETNTEYFLFTSIRFLVIQLLQHFMVFGWEIGEEIYVIDTVASDEPVDSFKAAVFEATQRHRRGETPRVRMMVEPTKIGTAQKLSGQVLDVRQSLLEAKNNKLPLENALVIDTGAETVDVVGPYAHKEAYRARGAVQFE